MEKKDKDVAEKLDISEKHVILYFGIVGFRV